MGNMTDAFSDKLRSIGWVLWMRRWLAFAVAVMAALTGAVAVSLVPDRYEAKGRIYVDTQTALKPLMEGLAFQPDIDLQVRMLARTLISRPNMERMLASGGLGFEVGNSAQREQLIAQLMNRIKVVPAGADNLYEIAYRDTSPRRAQAVVQATMDLFVHAGVGSKKRDSEGAGRFIDEQIRFYEGKLVEAESRLKEFKKRNFAVSGVSEQDYFTRVSLLAEEESKLRMGLEAAEQARNALRQQLEGATARLSADLPVMSAGVAEVQERLDKERKKLFEHLQRFTEQHPDVIMGRQMVEELTAELQRQKEAALKLQAEHGRDALLGANPIYQKLRITFAEAEAQVASLRSQLTTKQEALARARAVGGQMPEIEAELAQLNRDYEILRKNYDGMVARREAALLGVKLDQSSHLAEFRVIEPSKVSMSPVFPSRVQLAAIVMAASLALGVIAAKALDLLRPTIDAMHTLRQISDRPVLGVVSTYALPGDKRREREGGRRFLGAVGMLLLLQGVWVGWVAWAR